MANPQQQGDAIMQLLGQEGARRMANFQQFRQKSANTWLQNFLYRVVFGPQSQPGDGAPHALLESFNPRNRAGLVNDLSMFAGGPKGEDILNANMAGARFEPYSVPKAAAGGHVVSSEGLPYHRVGQQHGFLNEFSPKDRATLFKKTTGLVQGRGVHKSDPMKALSEHLNILFKEGVQRRNINSALRDAEDFRNHQAFLRRQAALRTRMTNKVNEHLHAEPATFGQALHRSGSNPAEHDYFDSPEFDRHLHDASDFGSHHDARMNLLHSLMRRRYQAQLGHNHLN